MKYDFKCNTCNHIFEVEMSVKEYRGARSEGVPCISCEDGNATPSFNVEGTSVCFTGFDWSDKNYKEKEYRKNRSAYLGTKQKETHHVHKLVPNYKGERTESWREARENAKRDGKSTRSYEPLVQKETLKPPSSEGK